jgi:FlaA1/EpsC-like NDP-sugar epimerase
VKLGLTRFAPLLARVRNRHLLISDILLLPVAAVLAFALRLDYIHIRWAASTMVIYAIAAPFIQIPIYALLGVYSQYWQFASTSELILLASAATIGGLVQGALFLGLWALFPDLLARSIPRSVPLIDILVTLVLIAAPRLALRVLAQNTRRQAKNSGPAHPIQRVLIAGAGEAGAMVLRELRANPQTGLIPVGFVDDDQDKQGVVIHRLRVLGRREAIPELARQHQVEQVIIAMPTAPGKTIREIANICETAGIRARIIPGMYELLNGAVHLNQLRDVQIEDLLRREPVRTDPGQVATLLQGRRVLVTGAGGSIGSELCRQIVRCDPAQLILLGHGENSIFDIYNELGSGATAAEPHKEKDGQSQSSPGKGTSVHAVIADIRFAERLQAVFEQYRPEIVFHAAAHKHVPLMEVNVEDAITNNVLGTQRLVEASVAAGVSHFVSISTDKAVNPASVMGATKRVAELIVQDAARTTGRCFVAVRFGNVLGSRGSVVPYFQKQIAAGGPVTVTHADMRRYFMTIPEAVQLVLQAAALGHSGELFVLDMGEPVRIVDLARDLIRLSGLEPDHEIEIRFTGLRPGEKLSEDLFGGDETHNRTQHEKIFVCRDRREFSTPNAVQALVTAAERGDAAEARRLLCELVPEYRGE